MTLKPWQAILLGLGWLLFLGAILQGKKTEGDLLRENEAIAAANDRLAKLDIAKQEVVDELIRRGDLLRDSLARENAALDSARARARREAHGTALALQAHLEGDTVGQAMVDRLRAAQAAELAAADGRTTNAERLQAQAEDERDGALALAAFRLVRLDTMTIDRDYWKGEALDLATEFSLTGWLPKGAWRVAGTVVICGGLGVGVGLAASDEVAGVAMAGGCGLGAIAF